VRHEPRLVLLGLNPGVGYDALPGLHGTWAERIQDRGYSYCFDRSPAEDPLSWTALHGKPSAYWAKLTKFTQRWLQDQTTDVLMLSGCQLLLSVGQQSPLVGRPPGGDLQLPVPVVLIARGRTRSAP
jgi:hypothetical protein